MATTWFTGVCDTLLQRIQAWDTGYENGEVYATRKYLSEKFEHMDVPVQFRHSIPFSLQEMTHLVRILTAEKPKWTLTQDFTKILAIMRNPVERKKHQRMIVSRTDGYFVIALVCEKTEVSELSAILLAVKEGRPVITMDELAAGKKKAGKGMWER
jgi:hypothetical protein